MAGQACTLANDPSCYQEHDFPPYEWAEEAAGFTTAEYEEWKTIFIGQPAPPARRSDEEIQAAGVHDSWKQYQLAQCLLFA
jgi:hypothetical protein